MVQFYFFYIENLEEINNRYNLRKYMYIWTPITFWKCKIYIWIKNWSTTINHDSGAMLQDKHVLGTYVAQPWLIFMEIIDIHPCY